MVPLQIRQRAKAVLLDKTPDTPDQTTQRQQMESRLRSTNGAKWVEEHRSLLDYQWKYLKQVMGV